MRSQADIVGADGKALVTKTETVYLGNLISTSCDVGPELSRRLGEANSCFKALSAAWRHANIPKMKKLLTSDPAVCFDQETKQQIESEEGEYSCDDESVEGDEDDA